MKTSIRKSVFETNSSSVHSLTVLKMSTDNQCTDLVKDNILYPSVFASSYQHYSDHDHYYINNGEMWVARTFDEKAALLFSYIGYAYHNVTTQYPQFLKERVDMYFNYAKSMLPYTDIIFGNEYINPFEDRGDLELPLTCMTRWDDEQNYEDIVQQEVDEFVKVIKDPILMIKVIQGDN